MQRLNRVHPAALLPLRCEESDWGTGEQEMVIAGMRDEMNRRFFFLREALNGIARPFLER
jgi:hypothetical protein